MHARTEPASRERKQPAPGADIEKAQAGETVALEQTAKGTLGFGNLIGPETAREVEPVVAEPEAAILNVPVRHS